MRVPDDVEAKHDVENTVLEQDDADVQDEEVDELDALDEGDEAVIHVVQKSSKPPLLSQNDPTEREELARFREEWKAEVMRNKRGTASTAATRPSQEPEAANPVVSTPSAVSPKSPQIAASAPAPSAGKDPASLPLPPKLSKALEIYQQAVLHEQRSELDEALRLYRQAFRLDENVAKVYERVEFHARARHEGTVKPRDTTHAPVPLPNHAKRKSDGALELTQDFNALTLGKPPPPYGVATGTLAHIIASWPSNTTLEPEDENEPVHIRILPEEILVHIIRYLDISALERFASVNRKTRVLTLDSAIWRERAEEIFKPPQVADDETIETLLLQHMQDYRRLYIEHPHLRLDGVYIAVCHYLRDGLSDSAWINVSHLITYHRYLRFFPNGDVLSLLTNEEVPPQTVIPILKRTLRMKGLFIGQWRLEGTTVYITNLMDPSGSALRYSFQMILDLRSRPLGRWNRLDFRTYDSVSLESGEATPLALKNDRPFWFSKVRSYA